MRVCRRDHGAKTRIHPRQSMFAVRVEFHPPRVWILAASLRSRRESARYSSGQTAYVRDSLSMAEPRWLGSSKHSDPPSRGCDRKTLPRVRASERPSNRSSKQPINVNDRARSLPLGRHLSAEARTRRTMTISKCGECTDCEGSQNGRELAFALKRQPATVIESDRNLGPIGRVPSSRLHKWLRVMGFVAKLLGVPVSPGRLLPSQPVAVTEDSCV